MTCEVVPIGFRTTARKSWGASCKSQFAACSHGTSAVHIGFGSNFRGAALAASSRHQSDRGCGKSHSFCIRSHRAENDKSADDESWIADFRARLKVGELAEISADATVGNPLLSDTTHWRDFRARLYSSETGMCPGHEWKVPSAGTALPATKHWAHLISTPEVGCVLVATDKLRRHAFLKEAVVLVLGYAGNQYNGIVLNKSMPFPASTLQGVNQSVLLDLASCPTYVGGYLISAPKIHILSRHGGPRGFSTLLPGLCVGGDTAVPGLMNSIAYGKISPQELKLYIGQMEWEPSQFFAEVFAFEWWDVIACSSSLFDIAVTENLWKKLRSLYIPDPSAIASFD